MQAMKKAMVFLLLLLVFTIGTAAYAQSSDVPVNFYVNGSDYTNESGALIRNGVTYVRAEAIAKRLYLKFTNYSGHNSFNLSNSLLSLCLNPDTEFATLSDLTGASNFEYDYRILTASPTYINGHFCIAARDIADTFGYSLNFDAATNTVYFGNASGSYSASDIYSKAYYFQNQAEFSLPGYGGGYCWVCSYAMVMTNVSGIRITPNDIAQVNLSHGASGAYCYHSDIVSSFNLRFVSALPESSPYYGGRSGLGGGTYINNPTKSDAVATAALKEALNYHPEGILVRYESFPHTMVAVGYEGDVILFNDPAPTSSYSYSETGRYQGVPFHETCIPSRGLALADITYIQAIGY